MITALFIVFFLLEECRALRVLEVSDLMLMPNWPITTTIMHHRAQWRSWSSLSPLVPNGARGSLDGGHASHDTP
ncbi:hypothetical protein PybrP1_012070 [[Pythium] brassicae (nom. inval.)]|nr:hypothetical protein PybrP1_012070 [[Pythium] brassicae (nom. inval.)]